MNVSTFRAFLIQYRMNNLPGFIQFTNTVNSVSCHILQTWELHILH